MTDDAVLRVKASELVDLCHALGRTHDDLAILGEGNAATVVGDRQLVSATGSELASLTSEQVVAIRPAAVLDALASGPHDDAVWAALMADARTDNAGPRASIEGPLHVIAGAITGCRWSAHTHPVAVTAILASAQARRFADEPLFPDQIVMCGPRACLIPYVDPGYPLARATDAAIRSFHAEAGVWPRLLLLQNHGMVALGETAREVLNISLMAVKAARIFLAASSLGGPPTPLSAANIARIDGRADEHLRRRLLADAPEPTPEDFS